MPETIFLLPGPTKVPKAVAEAMAKPMINHRGEGFKFLYGEIQSGVQSLFGTRKDVVILPGSGTGAMECAAVNLLKPGDRALVVVMGAFGQRFAEICQGASIDVTTLDIPWGGAPDPGDIKNKVESMTPRPKAIFITHNETSTGICLDLEETAKSLKDTGALVAIDAVSSLGGVPVNMDEWGLDVVVTASQKALMTPPGLALVGLSQRAAEACGQNPRPRYYWDWRLYERDASKRQTPYTPALPQWFGLKEALGLMASEGFEKVYARHRRMSRMARKGLQVMGATPLGHEEVASPTVTAFSMPGSADALEVRKILTQKYDVVTGNGQGRLKGKAIRFGHMGAVTPPEVLDALERLGKALADAGTPVDIHEALEAARAIGGDTE